MSTEGFVRKNQGIVNTDMNALMAAKARKANSKKVANMEKRLDALEKKIDILIENLERLKEHE